MQGEEYKNDSVIVLAQFCAAVLPACVLTQLMYHGRDEDMIHIIWTTVVFSCILLIQSHCLWIWGQENTGRIQNSVKPNIVPSGKADSNAPWRIIIMIKRGIYLRKLFDVHAVT